MGLSKGAVNAREKLKENQRQTHGYLYCEYCKRKVQTRHSGLPNTLTIDHIVPRSNGGSNLIDNLAICCLTCNNLKANSTIKTLFKRMKLYNICVLNYDRYETKEKA